MRKRARRKDLIWLGDSLDVLSEFPDPVKKSLGFALHLAQLGGKASHARPMQGFGGASVLEIVEDDDGSTYRAVYTVRLKDAV